MIYAIAGRSSHLFFKAQLAGVIGWTGYRCAQTPACIVDCCSSLSPGARPRAVSYSLFLRPQCRQFLNTDMALYLAAAQIEVETDREGEDGDEDQIPGVGHGVDRKRRRHADRRQPAKYGIRDVRL